MERINMSDISLTASMRSNLLSLQNTQKLMDTTQERLSTGNKVNSAIDNPSSYYTAQSLNNRASDLEALLDSMGQGIQTIKAANEGIESITAFVQQAKAVANSARDTASNTEVSSGGTYTKPGAATDIKVKVGDQEITYNVKTTDGIEEIAAGLEAAKGAAKVSFSASADGKSLVVKATAGEEVAKTAVSISSDENFGLTLSGTIDNTTRKNSVSQFNDILTQIDQLANDANYKGVNLLKGDELKVVFNEDRTSSLTIQGSSTADAAGLGLSKAEDWSTNTAVDTVIESIDAAINQLRDLSSEFGNNFSIVQTRQDFTENLINVLTEGADNLTLADMNEESANMLALQTRQQLAINSLSLASQAAQSVLKLF